MSEDKVIRAEHERPRVARERYVFSGTQPKMLVGNKDPNFHYYWANDTPGRLETFEAAGYSFVSPEEISLLTPGVTPRNSAVDSRVSLIVGRKENGGPLVAFLMKKPMDWHLEDQRKGQERPDAIEEAIRQGRITSDTSDARHFYQPKGAPIKLDNDFRKP